MLVVDIYGCCDVWAIGPLLTNVNALFCHAHESRGEWVTLMLRMVPVELVEQLKAYMPKGGKQGPVMVP